MFLNVNYQFLGEGRETILSRQLVSNMKAVKTKTASIMIPMTLTCMLWLILNSSLHDYVIVELSFFLLSTDKLYLNLLQYLSVDMWPNYWLHIFQELFFDK